jgi:hypothetical protein
MGTVKVNIVHLNDMTPIVKPMALVGSRVLDEANGFAGTITGYCRDTGKYTVSNKRGKV